VTSSIILKCFEKKGQVFITMTPLSGMTWSHSDLYLRSKTDRDIFVVRATMYDNPYLSDEARARYLSQLKGNEREKQQRIYGFYTLQEKAIYPQFEDSHEGQDSRHVINEMPTTVTIDSLGKKGPLTLIHIHSLDPGATHATAAIFMGAMEIQGKIHFYIYDEYISVAADTKSHVLDVVKRKGNIQYQYNYSDQAQKQEIMNMNVILRDMGRKDFYRPCVKRVTGALNSVEPGLNMVRMLFNEDRIKITSNCVNLIHELQNYQYNDKGNIIKENDDMVDALRYGIISYLDAKRRNTVGVSGANVLMSSYAPTL